jgi:Cu-Zn family superoxide dismutase
MNRTILAASAAAAALVVAACATTPFDSAVATAKLEPTKGNAASGTVTFAQRMSKVFVTAEVSGLTPGEHGFHMHEKGDCSSGDGMSTGGHWNPDATPHGPQSGAHHAGDMPSLVADAAGNAKASFSLDGVTVAAGPKSVVGRGLIVHKDPDDYTTQPTGNAGARVACAVIQAK